MKKTLTRFRSKHWSFQRLVQGRLMVVTTNHPEKLDPALVRPGRVDLNMEFGQFCKFCSSLLFHRQNSPTGRSTPDDILDMFNNFYSSEALPVDFDKKRIPQDKWTPAEVVQVQPSQTFKNTSLDVSFHLKN